MKQSFPNSNASAPDVGDGWFIAVDGKPDGPFRAEELGERMAAGALGLQHQMWRRGMSGWSRLEAIPQLKQLHLAHVATWFLAVDGKPVGPLSERQLEQKLLDGMSTSSMVWKQGMAGWQRFIEMPELRALHERLLTTQVPPLPAKDISPPPVSQITGASSHRAPQETTPAGPQGTSGVAGAESNSSYPDLRQVEMATFKRPCSVAVNDGRVEPVDRLCQAVTKLFAEDRHVQRAIAEVGTYMREAVMVGNPFPLDRGFLALAGFVELAARRDPGQAHGGACQRAWDELMRAHAAAGIQVSRGAPTNLNDRLAAVVGLRSWASLTQVASHGPDAP